MGHGEHILENGRDVGLELGSNQLSISVFQYWTKDKEGYGKIIPMTTIAIDYRSCLSPNLQWFGLFAASTCCSGCSSEAVTVGDESSDVSLDRRECGIGPSTAPRCLISLSLKGLNPCTSRIIASVTASVLFMELQHKCT